MNEVIDMLISTPFAIAITAILRKKYPSIDGGYVYLVVFGLAFVGTVLSIYSHHIPAEVWVGMAPLLVTVLSIGGVTTAQHVVAKPVGFDPSEAPTKKEGL